MAVKNEVINEEYMKWLEKFTKKHPKFCNDDFMFYKKDLTEEDKIKVLNIDTLYNLIENYAKNYFIKNNKNWECYILKHSNNYYKIERNIDCIFCSKINNISENYIEFNDIMRFIKNIDNPKLNDKLKYLEQIIENLLASGVPSSSIENTTKNILHTPKTLKKVIERTKCN